jgi:hypothetical protein
LLVHAGAFNLGLWMRSLFGIGTPRGLQGRLVALHAVLGALWSIVDAAIRRIGSPTLCLGRIDATAGCIGRVIRNATCATGC